MPRPSKVNYLPKDHASLAQGLPPALPGTLFVLGPHGGMSVEPDARRDIGFGRGEMSVFGRGEPDDLHVCVGAKDRHVSRRHGYITREGSHWVLYNAGYLAIRFPGPRLVLGGHRAKLPVAFAQLFIVSTGQEHPLEVRIAARSRRESTADQHMVETVPPEGRHLEADERLVLACLSQRYLLQDTHPQPLTWAQVEEELKALRPAERWNAKRAARVVAKVRDRLSREVGGLREEEIQPPLGNALNHNLITDLLETATITKKDLRLLDEPPSQAKRA